MQKTVIINRGIPASGKSTFSKEIVLTLRDSGIHAMSHSTDDFFMVDGQYLFNVDRLREYHLLNQSNFHKSLRDSIEVVICDNTNIQPWEAEPYYNLAKEYNYKVILIDFATRDIKFHAKAQTNESYQRNIPLEVLKQMESSYLNYKPLTQKNSYPTINQPKREYSEVSHKIETLDEVSEPFYYESLIKIESKDYLRVKNIIGTLILKKIRDYSLNEIKLVPKKYKIIMEAFERREDKTLTAYDLEHQVGKSAKQIERDIIDLQSEFYNIIDFKIGKRKAFKLIDSFDVFIKAFNKEGIFKKEDEIGELFYLLEENNPEFLRRLESQILKDNSIYLFKNSIFERVYNREIFNKIKIAIKKNRYKKIKFIKNDTLYKVKCIKLIFIDNNWYLAYVDSKNRLKLGRVSFIEEVKNSDKNSYQKSSIEEHLKNLKNNLQNSKTQFDKDFKIAKIRAVPKVAKYFKKDMKKFLFTQEFQEELDDGSIIFTIKYTQPLEILPFIQKWIPDLIILEPEELKDVYKKKLREAIENLV